MGAAKDWLANLLGEREGGRRRPPAAKDAARRGPWAAHPCTALLAAAAAVAIARGPPPALRPTFPFLISLLSLVVVLASEPW